MLPQDASLAEQVQQWVMVLALGVADRALAAAVERVAAHTQQEPKSGTDGGCGVDATADEVNRAARVAICACLLLGIHQVPDAHVVPA